MTSEPRRIKLSGSPSRGPNTRVICNASLPSTATAVASKPGPRPPSAALKITGSSISASNGTEAEVTGSVRLTPCTDRESSNANR